MSVMIDDSVFTTASTTATPLQIEKAKVSRIALHNGHRPPFDLGIGV